MTTPTDRATTIVGPQRTADRLYHDILAPAEILKLGARVLEAARPPKSSSLIVVSCNQRGRAYLCSATA
jgi:hypothetical protein